MSNATSFEVSAPGFPPPPHVLVAGLGAIGTVVAGRLLASPRPPASVRVLAPGARAAAYRAEPPSLNGTKLALDPEAYVDAAPPADDASAPPLPDLVLVAVKAPALPGLLPALAAWTGPRTTVVSLLNGISAPRLLATALPARQVVPAIVTCNTAMRSGRAVAQSGLFRLSLGPRLEAAPELPAPAAIADFLSAAPGLEAVAPDDFSDALWLKFALNVGLNQAEALLGLDHGQLQANLDAMAFCRALMAEVAAVAAAEGLPVGDAATLPARAEALFASLTPRGRSSMLQDVDAGRPTEVALFAGEVVRLATLHHLPAPANQEVLRCFTI